MSNSLSTAYEIILATFRRLRGGYFHLVKSPFPWQGAFTLNVLNLQKTKRFVFWPSFYAFTTRQGRRRHCFRAVRPLRSFVRSFVTPDRYCYHDISWTS